ncbi:serine/threonine protein kinase [Streptomyces gardneri]|nr:serine/threonine-protein kinase [Streptomyces gardneri]QPK46492.1 serine/threonine protein kinase [Streptomyces gardneri]WRK37881.1 serine/threonine-protein kinase [Streptomyces venezuelae]CUM40204.1 putative serine/threonine protein kinase [Streptomyces venezuelae]
MLVADRYRLHVCIGRGGMGEVWQATDEVLGRPVAVKLMLGHGTDPSAGDRFRLEAQTAARLSHPHVVGVFDFGTWDGKLFLVMELVEGDSLAGSPSDPLVLPAERVAVVAAHAAAGLAAAHRQGVVHRDIKPGNLLVDAEGTVKLADFGIARFVDDPSAALTTTGQIVGTGLYLAPERALGQPASSASDVYSLGCVLYQLLTGQPPFRADTATALLYQHIDTAPVPPGRLGVALPPVFETYLLSLLAKQPEQRPSAQAIADWFSSGAWRGYPQPGHQVPQSVHGLPQQVPQPGHQLPPAAHQLPQPAHQAPQPIHQAPRSVHQAPPSARPPQPPTQHVSASPPASRRRERPSAGGGGTGGALAELSRRRPRKTAAVAGAIAFVVFLVIGMAWLS